MATGAPEEAQRATTTSVADLNDYYDDDEYGDYDTYDYKRLEEHDAASRLEYENLLEQLQNVVEPPASRRGHLQIPDVGVLLGKDAVRDADLFVENSRPWNARDNFLQTVAARLYMLVPAFFAGVLIGWLLWAAILLTLKAFGKAKRRAIAAAGCGQPSSSSSSSSSAGPQLSPNAAAGPFFAANPKSGCAAIEELLASRLRSSSSLPQGFLSATLASASTSFSSNAGGVAEPLESTRCFHEARGGGSSPGQCHDATTPERKGKSSNVN